MFEHYDFHVHNVQILFKRLNNALYIVINVFAMRSKEKCAKLSTDQI